MNSENWSESIRLRTPTEDRIVKDDDHLLPIRPFFDDLDSLNTHSQHSSDVVPPDPSNRRRSLASALAQGDHPRVREILKAQGKSTKSADRRFLTFLTRLARGPLEKSDVTRLRKGLLHIVSDWTLTGDSLKTTQTLAAFVVILECWLVALRQDALCIVRSKIDYLVDLLDAEFLNDTRLATVIQFTLRSLRDPNRRDAARGRFEKFVADFRRRIHSTVNEWKIENKD